MFRCWFRRESISLLDFYVVICSSRGQKSKSKIMSTSGAFVFWCKVWGESENITFPSGKADVDPLSQHQSGRSDGFPNRTVASNQILASSYSMVGYFAACEGLQPTLGPPVVPFDSFLGEVSLTTIDYRKELVPFFSPLYWRTFAYCGLVGNPTT